MLADANANPFSEIQKIAGQNAIVICTAKDAKHRNCPHHSEDEDDIFADFFADDTCHKCLHSSTISFEGETYYICGRITDISEVKHLERRYYLADNLQDLKRSQKNPAEQE